MNWPIKSEDCGRWSLKCDCKTDKFMPDSVSLLIGQLKLAPLEHTGAKRLTKVNNIDVSVMIMK